MCGIIGVFNHKKAAELAMLGLFAEQHRGQESCGMAVNNGRIFNLHKKMGLVKSVFTPEVLSKLDGEIAIGHVRYPTRGSSTATNSQPHIVETLSGPNYALASNGDIVNYHEIRRQLEEKGVYFKSTNDGELILKYIIYHVEYEKKSIPESIRLLMKNVRGAFSTVLATRNEMYCFRDPLAIRPMVFGEFENGSFVVASESCALDILHPKKIYEMEPAEIVIVNDSGVKRIHNDQSKFVSQTTPKHCIFEHVYFSRPDSIDFDEAVYQVRENIGRELAKLDNFTPDAVVPVPDSANFIATGYAKEKNIPYEMGLIRNHYVGRTFIKPEQTIRDESVKQKFNVLPGFFKGKSIVLVDDSIVRGTTLRKIIFMIKEAGAKEVHMRIGSPAVKFSCYYGIDTPNRDKLIANKKKLAEIRDFIGADSLRYLPIENLKKTVSKPDDFCDACFTGNYPLEF